MNTTPLLILIPIFLTGCATTCQERDIYRPSVASAGDVAVDVRQTEVFANVASSGSIQIFECGWAKRDSALHPVALCLTIRVEDSHVFQFQPAIIRISSPASKEHELQIGKLSYSIFSQYKSDGSQEPDSTLKAPTAAPLETQRGQRYGNGRTDTYRFDAGAPFEGATSTFGPPMARAISENERRRQYFANVNLPSELEKQFVAELPTVSLDGKQYALPRLEFRYSRESVCSFNPP